MVIFERWSAVLQPQVVTYSGLQYLSTLSLNRHDFTKKHFLVTKFVLVFCTNFLWNIFHYKESRTRMNKRHPRVFMSNSDFYCQIYTKIEFSCQMFKNNQVPSFMKFRPCVQERTDRRDETNSRFSQIDATNKEPFFVIFSQMWCYKYSCHLYWMY